VPKRKKRNAATEGGYCDNTVIVDLNKVRTSLPGGLFGSFDGFNFFEEESSDDS